MDKPLQNVTFTADNDGVSSHNAKTKRCTVPSIYEFPFVDMHKLTGIYVNSFLK